MIATLAIARLAFRAALRSRAFAWWLLVLVVIVLLLPATLKGDGTAAGRIRIILGYTLSLSWFTLAAACIGAACSSIALEIEDKQLVLVATRPVSRARIWLGKWLGILALNAVLLFVAASTAGLYATLSWWRLGNTPEATAIRREILTARARAAPPPVNVDAEVERWAAEANARIDAPAMNEQDFRAIRRRLLARHSFVAPGSAHEWTIAFPPTPPADTLFLRCSFRAADLYKGQRITGTWVFLDPASGLELYRFESSELPSGIHTFDVPGMVVAGRNDIRIRFENSASSVAAAFDGDNPVELLLPCTGFVRNMSVAAFVLWSRLALLTALGLAAGTLFSFNVATFLTICMIVMSAVSNFYVTEVSSGSRHTHTHAHTDTTREHNTVLEAGDHLNRLVQTLCSPAARLDVITPLADGIAIPPAAAARMIALLFLGYPALLFAISVFVFNRRELAAWHRD
jgi:ABC-type transport system involved in multi-copper enzyme maturation permease subunit